jgi:hypothetical protein
MELPEIRAVEAVDANEPPAWPQHASEFRQYAILDGH